MKALLPTLGVSFFIFTIDASLHTSEEQSPVPGYELTWHDEFNSPKLDPKKWNYTEGKRRNAYNSREAVFVDDKGLLHLQLKLKGDSLLGSMINTRGLLEMRYGYFECRAKLTRNLGLWPAFWLLSDKTGIDNGEPETHGVEIDIFEYFRNLAKDSVTHNLHWGGYGAYHHESGAAFGALANTPDNFHTFGLEWTDHSYSTYVDGKKTASISTLISKIPEYIILSVESDATGGPLNRALLPDELLVDYVRVYTKKK